MRSPSSIPAALVLLLLLVVCRPPSASAAVLLVPPLGGTPHPLDQPHLGLTNREKWAHYFSRNPLTRLYRLYRDMAVVGLDFSTFDAVERPLVLNDGGVPPAY